MSTPDLKSALKQAQAEAGTGDKKRKILTPKERKERDEKREAERAQRQAERDRKKAEKPARKPAHMAKVEKAAEKLPPLTDVMHDAVQNVLNTFSMTDVQCIIAHMKHELRTKRTIAAAEVSLEMGSLVRIVMHDDAQHIGKLARVVEIRRIRSHVQEVGGEQKRIYILNSDVETVTQAEALTSEGLVEPAESDADEESAAG